MSAPSRRPRVLVYSPEMLPITQTWIRDHLAYLHDFDGLLAGRVRYPAGIDLAGIDSVAVTDGQLGGLRARLFLATGHSATLHRAINHFAPDLIHAHFGVGGTEILAIARSLRVPLVVTYHGWDARIGTGKAPPRPYEQVYLRRLPKLVETAALILSTSDFLREEVIAAGFPPERVETHYMGIDAAYFAAAPTPPPSAREVLIVSQMVPRKGVDLALDAVTLLCARGVDLHLTVIGDGPIRNRLEARARDEGLPVTFLGAQRRDTVREALGQARMHVYPSTTAAGDRPEPLGLGPLEAQAAGVPSIGTRSGGITEVIRDGETGFLIEDGDVAALADRMARLLADDALHGRMAAAARAFVSETFDVAVNDRRLEARYQSLLAGPGRFGEAETKR